MTYEEIANVYATQNPYVAAMHNEADNIQQYISIPINLQDPASLTERLKNLDVYLARLGDMMIRSKAMKERAKNSYIAENDDIINKLSATVSNRKIDAYLQDYTALYNRLDTMYSTLERLTRDLVTQISYIKKQIENFGG